MKILVITQRWYPDSFGGSELVASEQARRLAKRGHEVTVVTERAPSPQSSPTPHPNPLPQGEREIVRGQGEGSLRIYRYGTPEQFGRPAGRSRTDITEVPKTMHVILNKAKRSEGSRTNVRAFARDSSASPQNDRILWDIVILHHPFTAYGFFKSDLCLPTLYVFHASTAAEVEWEGTRWPRLTPLFVWWARRVERAVLRRADRIAVFSEFSRQVVEELVPEVKDKVVKLSVGVDTKKYYPAIPRNRRTATSGVCELLTVRRLTKRMGLIELVRAMKVVAEKLPSVHLTMVGEGPMRSVLEREVERLGLQSYVTLTGRVFAEDLSRYYQNADLFVLPTQAYEGLGMATLEALASGLPVVGTPVGATAEVLSDLDPTLITRSASAQDIAQGILDFFARPAGERVALRKKARKLAEEKYEWDKAIDQLEKSLALCMHKAKL